MQVRYQIERDGEVKNITKDLPADQMATKTTVYSVEERNIAIGDRIVFGKNDTKGIGVENGVVGTVIKVDEKGNMQVQLDSGKTVSFNINNYGNIDHGYAVTTEKSQGGKAESVIQFAYVRPVVENDGNEKGLKEITGTGLSAEQLKEWNNSVPPKEDASRQQFQGQEKGQESDRGHKNNLEQEAAPVGNETCKVDAQPEKYGRESYNILNTGFTRSEYEAHIMTNSESGLRKAVQAIDEKTSTVGFNQERQQQEVNNSNQNIQDTSDKLTKAVDGLSKDSPQNQKESTSKTDELSRAVNSYAEEGKTSKGPDKEQGSPQKQSEHKQEREYAKDNDRGVEM